MSDWSDEIAVVELSDEPGLSEELHAVIDRVRDAKGRAPHVVLNFAGVSYVNSSNLAQLLRLKKALHERDARLCLCAVAEPVWMVFTVTGLDKVFRAAPDPLSALAGLQIEDEQRGRS